MRSLFSFVIFGIGMLSVFYVNSVDLDYIRAQYEKAASDRKVCESVIAELNKNAESDVHLAYLGAFQTMWANHTFSPFSKLDTFNEGRRKIELAVEKSSDNAEIRFVRLSVQKNCPGFLGYNDNIKQDTQFLIKHKNTISSEILMKMVNELLIN